MTFSFSFPEYHKDLLFEPSILWCVVAPFWQIYVNKVTHCPFLLNCCQRHNLWSPTHAIAFCLTVSLLLVLLMFTFSQGNVNQERDHAILPFLRLIRIDSILMATCLFILSFFLNKKALRFRELDSSTYLCIVSLATWITS